MRNRLRPWWPLICPSLYFIIYSVVFLKAWWPSPHRLDAWFALSFVQNFLLLAGAFFLFHGFLYVLGFKAKLTDVLRRSIPWLLVPALSALILGLSRFLVKKAPAAAPVLDVLSLPGFLKVLFWTGLLSAIVRVYRLENPKGVTFLRPVMGLFLHPWKTFPDIRTQNLRPGAIAVFSLSVIATSLAYLWDWKSGGQFSGLNLKNVLIVSSGVLALVWMIGPAFASFRKNGIGKASVFLGFLSSFVPLVLLISWAILQFEEWRHFDLSLVRETIPVALAGYAYLLTTLFLADPTDAPSSPHIFSATGDMVKSFFRLEPNRALGSRWAALFAWLVATVTAVLWGVPAFIQLNEFSWLERLGIYMGAFVVLGLAIAAFVTAAGYWTGLLMPADEKAPTSEALRRLWMTVLGTACAIAFVFQAAFLSSFNKIWPTIFLSALGIGCVALLAILIWKASGLRGRPALVRLGMTLLYSGVGFVLPGALLWLFPWQKTGVGIGVIVLLTGALFFKVGRARTVPHRALGSALSAVGVLAVGIAYFWFWKPVQIYRNACLAPQMILGVDGQGGVFVRNRSNDVFWGKNGAWSGPIDLPGQKALGRVRRASDGTIFAVEFQPLGDRFWRVSRYGWSAHVFELSGERKEATFISDFDVTPKNELAIVDGLAWRILIADNAGKIVKKIVAPDNAGVPHLISVHGDTLYLLTKSGTVVALNAEGKETGRQSIRLPDGAVPVDFIVTPESILLQISGPAAPKEESTLLLYPSFDRLENESTAARNQIKTGPWNQVCVDAQGNLFAIDNRQAVRLTSWKSKTGETFIRSDRNRRLFDHSPMRPFLSRLSGQPL